VPTNYVRVPDQVTLADVRSKGYSWSCGLYQRVVIPNRNVKPIRVLLDQQRPVDKGVEPGSIWYLAESSHHLIRTKALQEHSNLVYPKGDAIAPINPRVFEDPHLKGADILLSKDSNIGECGMVDDQTLARHMYSGGILRLRPIIDRFYLFAFLKHPLFKQQLDAMVPRGATIRHAKSLWMDCLVPFPAQEDKDRVCRYVSVLMQAIVEKEKEIRRRSDGIHDIIQTELESNQKPIPFTFQFPSLDDLRASKRMDACIYDREYRSKIWVIENYKGGFVSPGEDGFKITPGPSLEIKIIRTRIDSDVPRKGFYTLIVPMHISLYGTMNKIVYLGTGKDLPLLKRGDIVFGEAGFQKGRSIVLLDGMERCTTNAHGLYARRTDGNVARSIFFRCVFNWYRSMRLIDLMAVGGSGGHFSPEYFDYVRIPLFPEPVQAAIVRLYHNAARPPDKKPTLSTFVEWHREWNRQLGIWELDCEMKLLQTRLAEVQELIIAGKAVNVPMS
jgi:hypothetical protein